MYPVSEDFLTEIVSRTRQYEIYGMITTTGGTEIEFSNADIKQGSGSITRETTGDNTFRFGGGCAAELEISFPLSFSDYLVEGSKIELFFSLVLDEQEEEAEEIPLGVYYIQSAKRGVSAYISVVAYDSMYKLHTPIDFVRYIPPSGAVSPYSWINFICTACGVTLGSTQEEIEALPNGTVPMQYKPTGTPDWYNMMQAVTEMLACFAYIGRDDKLYLRQYSTTSDFTYTDSARYSTEVEDFESFYTSIHGTAQDVTASVSPDNGLMYETDNPFVFSVSSVLQNVYDTILTELVAIGRYRPLNVSVLTNPALDPGDMVTIIKAMPDGTTLTALCPIMKIQFSLYGKSDIQGYGDNPNAKETNGSVNRSLNGLTQTVIANTLDIEELKTSAIKFLLPTTTSDNPIADGETNEVIQWVFECAEGAEVAVSATAAFEIETTATTDTAYGDAVLTVSYKMDGAEFETYSETYGDGEHILTLSHILTMELSGIHTLTVEITMEGGDLT